MTPELTRLLIIILLCGMLAYGVAALAMIAAFGFPSRVPPPPPRRPGRSHTPRVEPPPSDAERIKSPPPVPDKD